MRSMFTSPSISPPSLVVVTGANGFIAAHTISLLLEQGFRVLATVRSKKKARLVQETHARLKPEKACLLSTAVVEDITSTDAYTSLFQEHEPVGILHMASSFQYSTTDFEHNLLKPAVQGTKVILDSASKTPSVQRVVHTNSFACIYDAALGPRPDYVYTVRDFCPLSYDDGVKASNAALAYRASKAVAEQAAYSFLDEQAHNFDYVSLCPAMVFGPFVDTDYSVPADLNQLNTSNQIVWNVISAGEQNPVPQTKGPVWIDVRDVAEAHIRALTTPTFGGQRLLLAKGIYCNQEIADLTRKLEPNRLARIPVGSPGEREAASHFGVDATKEEKELGRRGKWRTLEETLGDLVPQLWAIEEKGSKIPIQADN